MTAGVDIDPLLTFLGPKGRFQLWQMILISIGGMCAQNQLFDIIFIGKDVPFRCAAPSSNVTSDLINVHDVTVTSEVRYDQCDIIVITNSSNGVTETTHDCLYGYEYDWDIDMSFVSEFGLVCDRYLLVSLSQTFLVLGQGIGAFVSSVISDRFGRRRVLIGSQLGLLVVGVAIGAAPSYPVLVVFKCVVGACQQGVVAGIATMGIELFPRNQRSLSALIIALWWAAGACVMALFAFCLRDQSWRVLQYALSSVSLLVVLLQVFLMEESLRWLVANGQERDVLRVLKKASRANKKNLDLVLCTLHNCQQLSSAGTENGVGFDTHDDDNRKRELTSQESHDEDKGLNLEATRHLTVLDLCRHSLLRFNALLTFFAWFTVAFVVFTLYLMSTSYAGDPYLNYFLAALMEAPPAFLLYFGVDRLGRKLTVQGLFGLAGFGCIASAVCLLFPDSYTLARLSAVFAMLGMVGGSGAFGGLFLYTPEYFPTNLRNQALGTGSSVGRVGGMIAPFMKNLAVLVVWGPGLISGCLCVMVVLCVHFLPETKSRQLPTQIEDIEAWYKKKEPKPV